MTYYYVDPEGLEGRALGKKKVKPTGHFTTKGCNWGTKIQHTHLPSMDVLTLRVASYSGSGFGYQLRPVGSGDCIWSTFMKPG